MNSPIKRTSPKKTAKTLAKILRKERPDYNYLKTIFRYLREELEISVAVAPKRLPYVPTEEEIQKYYEAVWQARHRQDMVIIKTLLYTGVRVSELVNVKLDDVDFKQCLIRINAGKGKKDRMVPFPSLFKEILAIHADIKRKEGAAYLFESSWKRQYTARGIRKILLKYSEKAGMKRALSPHKLRHFLFTWLKTQGIDDALIQPYSGHETRQSLEIYSKLSIGSAQQKYNEVMDAFPV